ncbi:aldehyde dehydrogenase family protein [Mycobacterium kansasii]|uniref:Aldehyde dehydrogenase family protein n=1 Tax=Mycobacterium kansasii TaxID=1768 RepID=A0A1V3XP90_MYCKA|nr:aldehyde dehydrogenase family protein [Mycobacterium kansasii]
MISDKQRKRVLGYISKGVEEGATCLVGGRTRPPVSTRDSMSGQRFSSTSTTR